MKTIPTFDQLPETVMGLSKQVSKLETLILSITNQGKHQTIEHPLPIEAAAEFLNLSKPTIYSKVSRGELPYSKRGKRLYFFKSELLAYLKQGHQKTNSEIEAEAHTYLRTNKKGLK